ncbi:MAG: GspH/FimT family pseudopilin [Gammaproteobacteria bacterium]|nr:GspH/FimT family pseudopilin [Gammaproteobacteria bacterium]
MNKETGFTVIELMVTLAVALVLVTMAVPAFNTFMQNNRITAQANDLLTAINASRDEALKRRATVTICSSSDGSSCTGNWHDGWIVFTDDNADSVVNGTDQVLRVWGALTGGATLSSAQTSLRYDGIGLVNSSTTFQLRIPGCKGNLARDISVSVTGQPSVTHSACS